jgi:multiple sugar transport system ATP-binding protein
VNVRYESVSKFFGSVEALSELDLEIPDGSFMVMLGPSGCGKTTGLRLAAGLEVPSSGNIYLGRRDVTAVPPRERDVAMVFQSYALYPHMTVLDNIAYPLRVRKISRRERDRQATTVAESLMIGPLLDRKPRELSGGQRQRVALARAIVRQPAVFLMDEPLSNLDAKLRIQMRVELKRLQRELNVTTLYVTHDQSEATTMADLVAVMANGRLEQLGTPREIYNFPRSETVARFVGSPPMNVTDVGISDSRLFIGSQEFPVDDDIGPRIRDAAKGRVIRLGVRPEDLVPATDRQPALDSEVYMVQPMDNETLVTVRCADSTLLTGRFPADFEPAVGSRLRIRARDDRLHIFDRGSGESLLATRRHGDTAGPGRPDATSSATMPIL